MRKILPFISVSVLFSGCCSMTDGRFCDDNFTSATCGSQVSGYTHTAVVYGDSEIVVIPISQIRENTEWRFILAPITRGDDIVDFSAATVTITGQNDAAWIQTAGPSGAPVTGNFDTDKILTACVKGLPNLTVGFDYKFEVKVAGLGTLDPRGRVK